MNTPNQTEYFAANAPNEIPAWFKICWPSFDFLLAEDPTLTPEEYDAEYQEQVYFAWRLYYAKKMVLKLQEGC